MQWKPSFSRAVQYLTLLALSVPGVYGMLQLTNYSVRSSDDGVIDSQTVPELFDDLHSAQHNRTCCVLFYHPKCPCTMATVRMLQRRLPAWSPRPHVVAVAWTPDGQGTDWVESSVTRTLRSIPGVEVVPDLGGRICRRYGISTSGHVLVFGPQGDLRFSGGITPWRGHEGPGSAVASFEEAVTQSEPSGECRYRPVLGCSL